MGDIFLVRVQAVEDDVGVAGVAGCEHYKLEVFGEVFDELFSVRTDIHPGFDNFSVRELDGDFKVADLAGVVAVDQSLVKVKNYCFSVLSL